MRILLIPLDDRPPSRVYPQRLAAIAGIELQVAPQKWLGKFLTAGEPEALIEWLLAGAAGADAVIFSADMLCYGGLVASRAPGVSAGQAVRRLSCLKTIKQSSPRTKVYCSSTLTRLTITSSDPHRLRWSSKIFTYSRRREAALSGDECAKKDCETLRQELPEDLLQPYLEARQRNLEVSSYLVRQTAASLIDYLVLTQEDCATEGIHRIEQAELSRLISDLGVQERAAIYPGADEASMTLLSRAITTLDGRKPIRFIPHFWPSSFAQRVPPYEDRPLKLSLQAHVRAAGCHYVNSEDASGRTATTIVPVEDAPGVQLAIWGGGDADMPGHGNEDFVEWVSTLASRGESIAVADLAQPNGADDALLQQFARQSPSLLGHLSSFAGWNTAGNSLGTVLAHIVCLNRATNSGSLYPLAHYRFLFERLVDDWAYQSQVRVEINAELQRNGVFAGNLGSTALSVEAKIRERLLPIASWIFNTQFNGIACREGVLERLESIELTLPWQRTFELEVSATLITK